MEDVVELWHRGNRGVRTTLCDLKEPQTAEIEMNSTSANGGMIIKQVCYKMAESGFRERENGRPLR